MAREGTMSGKDVQLGFWRLIRSDIRAKAEWVYGSVSGATLLKTLLTDGTFAMTTYRLMHAAQRKGCAREPGIVRAFDMQ